MSKIWRFGIARPESNANDYNEANSNGTTAMGIGEWAALAAALMWTSSSMIWGKIKLSAMGINLCKNIIGCLFIFLHLMVFAWLSGVTPFAAPIQSWGWLGLSGMIGIVVGDTLYFRSLQILGPRKALMMATTSPLFAAVLAAVLLNEQLKFTAMIGILITVAGVIVVVSDRKAKQEAPGLLPGSTQRGVLAGLLGAVCQAVGGVYSKKGMLDSEGVEVCGAIEATFIRLAVAAIATVVIVSLGRKLKEHLSAGFEWKTFRLLVPATAIGTWFGIWLSQIAYGHAEVAIAQTLLATCPLFAIPIVALVYKHHITMLSVIGTLVALTGIYFTVSQN